MKKMSLVVVFHPPRLDKEYHFDKQSEGSVERMTKLTSWLREQSNTWHVVRLLSADCLTITTRLFPLSPTYDTYRRGLQLVRDIITGT